MKVNKRPALVITTYNNPRALAFLFETLLLQTQKEFSIFVADDGSTSETRALIDSYRPRFSSFGELEHFWHEDQGYRKSVINNVAFSSILKRKEQYPVLICIDGDTFLNRHFVSDHWKAHDIARVEEKEKVEALFMGRRVELGPRFSGALTRNQVCSLANGITVDLLRSMIQGDTKNGLRAIRLGSPTLRRWLKLDRVPDLLGSNFSISATLLERINGYNEDYQSYWGEDGDLFVRARNSGARLIGSRYYAVQFHLHHRRLDPNPEHQARYRELLNEPNYRRCLNGIVKSV